MKIDLASQDIAAHAVLAQQARDLVDAVAVTDVAPDEMAEITAELLALTERLKAARKDAAMPYFGNAVVGPCNPHALPLEVEGAPEGGSRAELTFRPTHEGPPGGVHGGVTAMILDHLLGDAAARGGAPGVTGTLSVRYRRPTPYGTPLVATAEVSRVEGRKSWADGRISLPDGTPLVEATALLIAPREWPGLTR